MCVYRNMDWRGNKGKEARKRQKGNGNFLCGNFCGNIIPRIFFVFCFIAQGPIFLCVLGQAWKVGQAMWVILGYRSKPHMPSCLVTTKV